MSERGRVAQLSTMMALLYAVQGAWWPLMAVHLKDLGIVGSQRGWIFACQPMGTLLVSLGLGRLVDRVWPTQRVIALIFVLGTVGLGVVASGVVTSAGSLFVVFLGYWLLTAPCYGLANSLTFRNLPSPGAQFGGVRLWGTVGWMGVGWLVSGLMSWSGSTWTGGGAFEAFQVATVASALFAAFALTLPNTPPLAGRNALTSTRRELRELLLQPGMRAYLITAFGVCLTTPFVFQVMPTYLESRGVPRSWTATVLTLGQWPEIVALAFLPRLLRWFGFRATLGIGLMAWFIRFATLAMNPPLWLAVAGTALHGVGIGCFTIGGQIFVDQCARPENRATAQALNLSLTSGMGSLLGSLLAGSSVGGPGGDTSMVFVIPCLLLTVLIIFFGLSFSPLSARIERRPSSVPARRTLDGERGAPAGLRAFAMESADG